MDLSLGQPTLAEVVERICIRYDGQDRGLEFACKLLDRGDLVLLDIQVDRVISWVDDG